MGIMQIMQLTLLLLLSYTTASQAAPIKTYTLDFKQENSTGSYRDLGLNVAPSQIYATIIHADLLNGKILVEINSGSEKIANRCQMPSGDNAELWSSIDCDKFYIVICTDPNGCHQRPKRYISKVDADKSNPVHIQRPKKPILTIEPSNVSPNFYIGNNSSPSNNNTIENNSETQLYGTKSTKRPEPPTNKSTTNAGITVTTDPPSTEITSTLPPVPPPNDGKTSTDSPSTTPPTDQMTTDNGSLQKNEVSTDASTPSVATRIESTPNAVPEETTYPSTPANKTPTNISLEPVLPTTSLPIVQNLPTEMKTTAPPKEYYEIKPSAALVAAPLISLVVLLLMYYAAVKCPAQPRHEKTANHEMDLHKPLIGTPQMQQAHNHNITESLCVHV